MQLPVLKSITDVRRDTKAILNEVRKKKKIVLVTKNNDGLSVIMAPDYFQSIIDENESLWEELEMIRSKESTKKEKSYPLKTVLSGKI